MIRIECRTTYSNAKADMKPELPERIKEHFERKGQKLIDNSGLNEDDKRCTLRITANVDQGTVQAVNLHEEAENLAEKDREFAERILDDAAPLLKEELIFPFEQKN